MEAGYLNPLLKFVSTLNDLEFNNIKSANNLYVIDYGIKINPNFAGQDGLRQDQLNRDLTINELR